MKKFIPQRRNANKKTERGLRLLEKSLQQDGWIDAQTAAADGEMISGSARLEVAAEKFADVEPIIVESDGTHPVIVVRTDIPNLDDPRAKRLSVAANQIAHTDYNPDGELLKEWAGEDEQIRKMFADSEWQEVTGENISGVEKGKKPNPRKLPLDIIYTVQMADVTCCLAVLAGWKYGINSAHYRLCPYTHQLSQRHEVIFIDNDYFNYDHQKHLDTVRMLKPKYCTVRDLMTEKQCQEAKIDYYSFGQVMEWAEELSQYAENVIVIPKYDCIKDIPEKFMLGYSIPTSHGGTPLPVDLFKGRRVHLLGGSWKAQLEYLAELGEDVVSLDNNHLALMADKFGQYDDGEGDMKQVKEVLPNVNNVRYVALALSFGAIASKVNELYGHGEPVEEMEKTE